MLSAAERVEFDRPAHVVEAAFCDSLRRFFFFALVAEWSTQTTTNRLVVLERTCRSSRRRRTWEGDLPRVLD